MEGTPIERLVDLHDCPYKDQCCLHVHVHLWVHSDQGVCLVVILPTIYYTLTFPIPRTGKFLSIKYVLSFIIIARAHILKFAHVFIRY